MDYKTLKIVLCNEYKRTCENGTTFFISPSPSLLLKALQNEVYWALVPLARAHLKQEKLVLGQPYKVIPTNLRRNFYQCVFIKSETHIFIKSWTEKKIRYWNYSTENFHRTGLKFYLFVFLHYVQKPHTTRVTKFIASP